MKSQRRLLFCGDLSPALRAVALLLIPLQCFAAVPVPVVAALADSSRNSLAAGSTARLQPSPETLAKQPQPVAPVKVDIPVFAPPSRNIVLSDSPSDAEIIRARGFEEPLAPSSREDRASENTALARALNRYHQTPSDLTPLVEFVASHPDGRWAAALQTNLGLLYRGRGQWSKALAAWESSWALSKEATDVALKNSADRALGELAELNARLGRFDRLEALFKEIAKRDVRGSGTNRVDGARSGLWLMKNNPGEAFRCGPLAVGAVFEVLFPGKAKPQAIQAMRSTEKGTCLSEVAELAAKAGVDFQMAFREPKAAVLIPSVVNWKVGHFAALTKKMGDGYLSKDDTFGTDTMVTAAVLDEEASGYFLVPAGPLPAGWRSVSKEEGAAVWGKGNAGPGGPPPPPKYGPRFPRECDNPDSGMATYGFEPSGVCLTLSDNPVGYQVAYGPEVAFRARYNHREAAAMANISNLGPKWSFDWLSYIIAPSDANTKSYGPGGGQLDYAGFDSGTGNFSPQLLSQDKLVKLSATSYEKYHRDGSKEVFDVAEPGVTPRIFRTKFIDPSGNTITYGFDSNYRLRTVTDAAGKVTVIDYALSTDPVSPDFYKITKVTDPYGRFATMQYNAQGQLYRITDVIGLISEFSYQAGDFVNALTTPYGTTTFAIGDVDQYHRWLEATDPMGAKERIEFNGLGDGSPTPDTEAFAPAGFINANLSARNTFYWDKKAMLDAPGDFSKAHITHWVHANGGLNVTPVVESTKKPLENRVWKRYANQPDSRFVAATDRPIQEIRFLDDGSQQIQQYEYSPYGKVTKSTDPLGRETVYEYDSNQIDLLRIKQKNGAAYDLLTEYTYNPQHLPLTIKDASGRVTTNTYNASGQISTVTNAKSEVTKYYYDPLGAPNTTDLTKVGYLVAIDGPLVGTSDITTYAYDAFGRARTVTDTAGYAVVTDYDAFDRRIKTTYPDTTFDQMLYNRLDLEWSRDRLGRWTYRTYDALRRLAVVIDPLNRVTQYDWCICGALSALIDPAGNRTSWLRDLQLRLISKVYPDGRSESFTYESATSRLKKKTDAKRQVAYTYNLDDSIAAYAYTDANGAAFSPATPAVAYTYDLAYPRIATRTDGLGVTAYAYNPITGSVTTGAGRLASLDGPLTADTITYSYDELGRTVQRAINGAANQTSIVYDQLGRVTGVTTPLGAFATTYVGATGQVDHVDYPNGQRTNYAYYPNTAAVGTGNGDQRLQQIKHLAPGASPATISQFDYAYDVTGRIATWTLADSSSPDPRRYSFGYDAADQLTSASLVNVTTSAVLKQFGYGYDSAGNRVREQIDAAVNTSTHNNLNQLTDRSGGGKMEFSGTVNEPATVTLAGLPANVDGAGNWRGQALVAIGANTIPVVVTDVNGNAVNKTITITVSGGAARTLVYDLSGNLINNGVGQTYIYDAANRLTTITQGGNVTGFVYNAMGQRVQEKLNGTIIKQWIWCDGPQPCEERDGANNVTKRFFRMGEQIAGASYFYTTDHLGSVREMTDGAGAIRARYDYDPYGRITKVSGDLEADFGFTGFYRHQATGLNLTLYRVYDADLGRWLSRDPIGEEGGINLYGYVYNNPINGIDPLGLFLGTNLTAGEFFSAVGSGAAQGAAAYGDGFIPFGDPFASNGFYDPCDESLKISKGLGKVGQVAATTALGLSALRAANAALMPSTLYHFTSAAGAQGIAATGGIQAGSGLYGTGVYLTGFNSSTAALLQGAVSTQAVISVPTAGLGVSATYFPGTYILAGASLLVR
jgi:RHS repeat-associated protein